MVTQVIIHSFFNFLIRGSFMDCLQKGCSCSSFLVDSCLILPFIDFSKNDNSDNNLALVKFQFLVL